MTTDMLDDLIAKTLPRLGRLGAMVRFDLGEQGAYVIDARDGGAVLADDGDDSDCTIKITAENLAKLIKGQMDPMLGYTLGRIKVKGSLEVAMRLVRAIG